ncbi:MAG: DHH family phosphoesterase [Phycisphaerales bacterium]|nr:DHH family phosphoesterase [Phycisphaerales bacterium]
MTSFEYTSNTTMEHLAGRLKSARKVLVTSHEKPDGDAIGSCAAVARALRELGIENEVWVQGAISDSLLEFVPDLPIREAPPDQPSDDHDLVVIVDTGAWSQLQPLESFLRDRRDSIIGFDHHARGDDVASERLIRVEAASCTELLVSLVDALGVSLEAGGDDSGRCSIAEALLLGLATDTGWFRFESCGADSLRVAARLVEAGADKSRIFRIIEENDRPARILMSGRAQQSAEFICGDRAVLMQLAPADFEETTARPEELSGLVNAPMSVRSVEVSVLITAVDADGVKVSFRSKPPLDPGSPFIDVNQLAAVFGGGGHVHAAGARIQLPLAAAKDAVRDALVAALQDAGFVDSGSTV